MTRDSCFADQWDVQATIKRVNESLIARGYVTWFDLTNMKGELLCPSSASVLQLAERAYVLTMILCGAVDAISFLYDSGSTVDAMSDAIEGADVMLYGVSLRYKESANVSRVAA